MADSSAHGGFEAAPEAVRAFVGAFFEELVRSGVRDVCISPGSRSTPLVAAAHAQPGLRCRPQHYLSARLFSTFAAFAS